MLDAACLVRAWASRNAARRGCQVHAYGTLEATRPLELKDLHPPPSHPFFMIFFFSCTDLMPAIQAELL